MFDGLKIYVLSACVAMIVGLVVWLALSRAGLQTDLAQAKGDYVLCQNANNDWQTQTQAVNQALERIKTESDLRVQKSAEFEKTAGVKAAAFDRHAKNILNAKASGDECMEAKKMLDAYFAQRNEQ